MAFGLPGEEGAGAARVDDQNAVGESDEGNNCIASTPDAIFDAATDAAQTATPLERSHASHNARQFTGANAQRRTHP
jgi:hypothetical protein